MGVIRWKCIREEAMAMRDDGDWVHYSDFTAAQARVEELERIIHANMPESTLARLIAQGALKETK